MKTACALFLAVILLAGCGGGEKPHSAGSANSSAASTKPSPAVLPADQATAIGGALTDGTPAKIETVLEPSVRVAYAKAPVRLLPAGSTVKVEPSSMRIEGQRASVLAVVTSAGTPTTWTLLLSKVSGRWLVYGTTK